MIDVKVRWNTQCDDDYNYWRIIVDGTEHLCSNVIFEVPVQTTQDVVWDSVRETKVDKHHVSCSANEVIWEGDVVIIK